MDVLAHFSLPYKGLGNGIHDLKFVVDGTLLDAFNCTLVKDGTIDVSLQLDKKYDHSILDFEISGTVKTMCDRCGADIDLPVTGTYRLYLKVSSRELDDEVEVMYILPETAIVNLGKVIYEFIILSLPMVKTFDCQEMPDPPCDFEALSKLETNDDKESGDVQNDIWNVLKNLDFEN